MSTFVAKKVSLDIMRECRGDNCSCFTDKGYFIQYRKGNVDSILFICEDCYNAHYGSKCTIGSFDEEEYQHTISKQRYYKGNPFLWKFLKEFRKGIRLIRIACTIFSAILITAFCLINQPQLRTEYLPHKPRFEINSNVRGLEGVSTLAQSILDRITTVISNNVGGKKDD